MNPRTQTEHIYPALAGRARTTLTPRFSLVAEAFIASTDGKTSQFCLTCRPHPRMETKSRYDDTGRTWINPTILKVLSYMNGKGEPETKLEKETGTGL